MENRKVLLCPAGCGSCPEVEFAGEDRRDERPPEAVAPSLGSVNVT